MDADPTIVRYQRRQKKRQDFKPVLQALVEGVASLVDGQRCFAEEFGLSYGRVFHDDLESFKGKDTCRVISKWLRTGEEGATMLRNLFDDLAKHQMALVEAADEVARESATMGKMSKSKLANMLGDNVKTGSVKTKNKQDLHNSLHQQMIMNALVTGYARSRERMQADLDVSPLLTRMKGRN